MVIIRINSIFFIITSGYMFRLYLVRAIFRLKYYLLKKVIYAIVSIAVDCEISRYIFKMLGLK